MNDLAARARAERLAAALGLTVRTNGNDRHGHSVSFHRGAERVDGCVSPNTVDAWLEAERKLRALARAELPDAAASAAGSARYGAGLRAAVARDVAKAARALDMAPPVVTRIGGGTPMLDDLAAAYVAAPNWGVLVESSLFGHRLRAVTTRSANHKRRMIEPRIVIK